VGCSSLGHVYGVMYIGKENPIHVYVAINKTINIAARVQVRKLVFKKV
jgi:hypothetical protein